ncbi:defensin alpha 4 [Ochotona princeps]|uniref:defensin alpha 4 n=1 Tax=Ochotona princeps TaxID=9978 RepID=UPI00032B15DD|nr:defensin alpha 4 [Ochotona princeps]
MRTLALLAVILLVALQAQAELLTVNADEVVDQQQSGAEDQDMVVYFTEDEIPAPEAVGVKGLCTCRRNFCPNLERRIGSCRKHGVTGSLCCRRR